MSTTIVTETKVSLKSDPEYLPRIRRIIACLADGAGMDRKEIDEASLALTEACVNAIRHGSPNGPDDSVDISLRVSPYTLVADVSDNGTGLEMTDKALNKPELSGMGMRLMRMLSDSVQFIRQKTGLTVRLTKHARHAVAYRRIRTRRSISIYRN